MDFDLSNFKKIADLLTLHTSEIEGVENEAEKFKNIFVAKIISISKHPNADKLSLCEVDLGEKFGMKQIVCGGNNLKEKMLVAVAIPGAKVKWHGEGDLIELKEVNLRGESSFGMICAGEEIALEKAPENGITDLSYLNCKIGMPLAEALEKNQIVIEVDNKAITHRPDLWGHYGFVRELSVILGKKLKAFSPKVDFPKSGPEVNFEIKDKEICRGASFCIVENLKIQESPQWIKSRLQAVGIRPINNIVDITNYVMLELGQPMHAYDRKFSGDHLILRKAKDNEEIESIDHKKRKLSKEDFVIETKSECTLVGIMGGANSEIKNDTNDIIFEAGCWDPVIIRKSSQRHSLRTDSSQRYEKSLHPKNCSIAIRRACELLKEIYPAAKIAGPLKEYNLWDPGEIIIHVNSKNVVSKIGAEISEEKIIKILRKLEFEANKEKDFIKVKVPYFRATKDVSIEDDIIEEVARIYGYENIQPNLPNLPIKSPISNKERVKKHISRKILAGLGFSEVMNYSFYSKEDLKNSLLNEQGHIKIENYLSEDQTHLRVSLIPNLLKSIHENQKNFSNFKIFEIGRTYIDNGQFMPVEEKKINAFIINTSKKEEGFYDAKGAVEAFLKQISCKSFTTKKSEDNFHFAHPNKSTDIFLKNEIIGKIFELHPLIKKNFDLKGLIAGFELNFTKLVALGKEIPKYKALSKFPSINLDISVVIDKKITVEEISFSIRKADSQLITEIELFDIFQDDVKLGKDKKALAFKIALQSTDRTLTDEEMTKIQNKIFENLETIGGFIRGR